MRYDVIVHETAFNQITVKITLPEVPYRSSILNHSPYHNGRFKVLGIDISKQFIHKARISRTTQNEDS